LLLVVGVGVSVPKIKFILSCKSSTVASNSSTFSFVGTIFVSIDIIGFWGFELSILIPVPEPIVKIVLEPPPSIEPPSEPSSIIEPSYETIKGFK
jgi:hypothetical protein